jgi:hypothetical protein
VSIVERILMDKYCFVQCPPESCNCRRGNPEKWKMQQARLGIQEPDEFPLTPATPPEETPSV